MVGPDGYSASTMPGHRNTDYRRHDWQLPAVARFNIDQFAAEGAGRRMGIETPITDVTTGNSQPSRESTSTSLLQKVRAGESQSWEQFVRVYGPLAFHWAVQAGADRSDAGDIVQEVFQAVAQHLASFDADRPGASFRGWLRTVARNKTRDHFRRRRDQPDAQGGTEAWQRIQEIPAGYDAPSADDLRTESLLAVHEAFKLIESEFSSNATKAFWQLVVEKRTAAEVAAEQQTTVGAIYMSKSRILKRLRELLQESLDWEP